MTATARPRVVRRAAAAVRRVPAAAWLCALVAFLNATAWSIVTPAFQLPDEHSHYAYTEYLAEHGRPPIPEEEDRYSASQDVAMQILRFEELQFEPENGTIWAPSERAQLDRELRQRPGRSEGNGGAYAVGGEPPLYYVVEAVPYKLAAGGTLLERLALMRLLSALLGGVTVLFTYLFLREALPGSPWTWTVGTLGVAFQPLFAFITGGVNSDALLYAACAALFFLLARGFRRGLTPAIAVGAGAAMAIGVLTKFNALGLVPTATLALLLIARRGGSWSARGVGLAVLAIALPLAAIATEMALNAWAWDRPAIGASASAFRLSGIEPSVETALSYVWQFYLAPLPGMTHYISDVPLKEQWINGFVGLYGWVDTRFSRPVYAVALVPLVAIALLAVRALVVARAAVWRRRAEALAYAAIVVGFMVFVALASYIVYTRFGQSVAQVRYLFPLLPFYALTLALATRGAGRRLAPVVGTSIVLLTIAHGVFSMLLVISRYYA